MSLVKMETVFLLSIPDAIEANREAALQEELLLLPQGRRRSEMSICKVGRLETEDVRYFKKLIKVFNIVFETKTNQKIDKTYLEKLLDKENFIAIAAFVDNKVIGGLTAYEMPLYNTNTSEVYIYDIAVLKEFQGLDFGTALIEGLMAICKEKGVKTIFVEAHATDERAIKFYRKLGGEAEEVVHFNFDL